MWPLVLWLFLWVAPAPASQGLGPRALAGLPRPLPRTWTVDAGGGGDFTSLQPAVDAAAEGDLILVRSDLLDGGASVQGKGLAIVGDGGRRVVRSAFPPSSQPALTVAGLAAACFDVSACPNPPAFLARDCQVHAFECTFRGADGLGSGGVFLPAGDGGQGIRLEGSSFLFASGCDVRGGDGGDGVFQQVCFPAGDGGAGLWVPAGTEAHLLETTLSFSLPGEIGIGPSGPCPGGTFGPPWAPAGPVPPFESAAGDVRSYALASPLRAPGGTLVARGVPGDLLVSVIADEPESIYQPLLAGTQLVAPPFRFRVEGTVPAGGVLSVTVRVPPLPAALGFAREFRQGLFLGPGADASLGSATAVVLVP